MQAMREAAAERNDLLTQLRHCQIELTQADPESATQLTEQHFALLGRYREAKSGEVPFPNRSVHVVAPSQIPAQGRRLGSTGSPRRRWSSPANAGLTGR